MSKFCIALLMTLAAVFADAASIVLHACDQAEGLNLTGAARIAPDGPDGEPVLRIDGDFSGRIDLGAAGIDPKQYDLIVFEAKTPRGAFMRFSLENYPSEGELSHWYVFDGTRGPSDWQTVWIDLRLIEEVKAPGKYKGLSAKDPTLRGLQLMGRTIDSRRSKQEPGTTIRVRNIRAVKKVIDLDWDEVSFTSSWEPGADLVYRYPLTLKNLSAAALTAQLELQHVDAEQATAKLSETRVELAAGASVEVIAEVRLPAAAATAAPPLHCERFAVIAEAVGVADSAVTILRSADPIHLNVTVPVPEAQLTLPLYPPLTELPEYVFAGWDEEVAREHADVLTPATARALLDAAVGDFEGQPGIVLHAAIGSAAFLYGLKGEEKYFDALRAVFRNFADVYSECLAADRAKPFRLVSDGLMARNILQFCFKFGGAQRPPYYYSLNGNGKAGLLFGHMHAFDLIAAKLSDSDRQYIIDRLFIPLLVQTRNHYFGLGNQQCNSNNVMIYGALVARHWPIAGFAYSAEHGLLKNIEWTFDDDGLCREGHYQEYTINPILHATEALYGCGIDLYDQRLYEIVHSKGATAIGMGYRYEFARFLDEHRFAGKPFVSELAAAETDGSHLTASTMLKWQDLEVAMNWGTHMFRSSHDRCALTVRTPRKSKDRELGRLACGGGSYNHSSFGQSIIIIDEGLQQPIPATVTGYDVEGPVQFVQSRSADHYPGSTITRTFVLLERTVLVVDRVTSERPRLVDWYLGQAGGETSLALTEVTEPLTAKPDDNRIGATFGAHVSSYQRAVTDGDWTAMNGVLQMLGTPGTEVRQFKGDADRGALIVRRPGVAATTFVACLANDLEALTQLPVRRADGAVADAVGLAVTGAGGKVCHVIINYEADGVEVQLDGLQTSARFASDY